MTAPDKSFWANKRVLLTGHTGFKGGWLAVWLEQLGARVVGIALPPEAEPNLFTLANIHKLIFQSHFCDVNHRNKLSRLIVSARPEIVFHLAAQPIVRASYLDPLNTFATNIMGTANVLNSLRDLTSVRVAVMITTDKVYKNKEIPSSYSELDALGGYDPYSASKSASEMVISSYRDAYLSNQGVAVATARAGNVIGGGDWAADRLLPDAVRAWQAGEPLLVRRPNAVRPWQHVLEPLAGYLRLAQQLWQNPSLAGAYNFGPSSASEACVRDVVDLAQSAFGFGTTTYEEGSNKGPHEADYLALNTLKTRQALGFSPKWTLLESIVRTMDWYKEQQQGVDAIKLCLAQIEAYEAMQ
jgi:CDP-glucose 4,6-dehydratase